MRHTIYFLYLISAIGLSSLGCKKNTPTFNPLASLKIVNTVTGGSAIRLNNYNIDITNNNSRDYTIKNDNIYVWPQDDSLHPYYVSNKINIEENGLYTLFLGGMPDAIEAIFNKESFPYRVDSTAAIRFLHFSPGGPTVNVTVSASPEIVEFSNIAYKSITEFKYFPAASSNSRYTFQVRDASTNHILASLTMSGTSLTNFVPRFRFVTLVFRGKVGGDPGPGVTRVNHY